MEGILCRELINVVDASSGLELKPEIKSSSFVFSCYLPTKDGKEFKASPKCPRYICRFGNGGRGPARNFSIS